MISPPDELFDLIASLVMPHSPSGHEEEIDAILIENFKSRGRVLEQDAAGNLFCTIPGNSKSVIAITAHKDEIGALVTAIETDGTIKVDKLGGSFPWVYGEGVVDLLGDDATVSGILSFGSRHVSHASPQFAQMDSAPLRWSDTWIETKQTVEDLAAAGVRPGTRVVVGRHRKAPFRMGNYVCSYALDNKASLAVLLMLAQRIRNPHATIILAATAKEEPGAFGALHFTQSRQIDAMIALEVAPIAPEYSIKDSEEPVLFAEDSHCLYDEQLNRSLRASASRGGIRLQDAVVRGFGSDASICARHGHVARAACLGFPTLNTHGFEIANLQAIERCCLLLEGFVSEAPNEAGGM